MINRIKIKLTLILHFSFLISVSCAIDNSNTALHYSKREFRIPMRDGVTLFTTVYQPKDTLNEYPFLLLRTPYNVAPYGETMFPDHIGPSDLFMKEGYIFVYQDVRGRFMSEGTYCNMRPNKNGDELDESRDTYDTIEWLLKNIKNHNGKVGMYGISYPGFYTTAAAIDAHPALVAVSPQAPIANWFGCDDWHHNGAFMLPHAFNFISVFGKKHNGLFKEWDPGFNYKTKDGYDFFLRMKTLKNGTNEYLKDIEFWNQVMDHPNYDNFWKEINILPHLKNIRPAVLVVGGWFDAENLYGALNTYKEIEKNNSGNNNNIIMGPWFHGGWARSKGDSLGNICFGQQTSSYYQNNIELPFFNYYLKGEGKLNLAEATVFETGSNQWKYQLGKKSFQYGN